MQSPAVDQEYISDPDILSFADRFLEQPNDQDDRGREGLTGLSITAQALSEF